MYCDVALPVPLDAVFTYRVNDHSPVVGGRVLVPFREKRLVGIVTELHDRPQTIDIKAIIHALDQQPVLDCTLMQLGQWIVQGKLKHRETIVEGLEAAPDALNKLFDGDNFGKLIVKVAD